MIRKSKYENHASTHKFAMSKNILTFNLKRWFKAEILRRENNLTNFKYFKTPSKQLQSDLFFDCENMSMLHSF